MRRRRRRWPTEVGCGTSQRWAAPFRGSDSANISELVEIADSSRLKSLETILATLMWKLFSPSLPRRNIYLYFFFSLTKKKPRYKVHWRHSRSVVLAFSLSAQCNMCNFRESEFRKFDNSKVIAARAGRHLRLPAQHASVTAALPYQTLEKLR